MAVCLCAAASPFAVAGVPASPGAAQRFAGGFLDGALAAPEPRLLLRLLEEAQSSGGDVPQLVALVSAAQLGRFEVPGGDASGGTVVEAGESLFAALGAEAPREAREALLALEAIPGPLPAALAKVLRAFVALNGAPQGAPLLATDAREAPGLALALAARSAFLVAAGELQGALAATPPATLSQAPTLKAPPVLALDFGHADNVYAQDYALLVDGGGNDTFRNNAGGSGWREACVRVACAPQAAEGRAAALLDFAGNDRYVGLRSRGANGGAHGGLGVLVDYAGNDRYAAQGDGANGGGYGGLGLLVDVSGDDAYFAGDGATNGGALAGGVGLLLDLAGADRYTGGSFATNGGGGLGSGALVDLSGDDVYAADLGGVNGGAALGEGLLLDGGGDDLYLARGLAANGGALQGGLGRLLDAAGRDRYSGGDVASNGGGFALGEGLLLDLAGDDAYDGGSHAVNGGGDGGSGALLDLAGNDTYVAASHAVNGGGRFRGAGALLDAEGNDTYLAGSHGANGGGDGGAGLLVDLGGDDRYVANASGANGGVPHPVRCVPCDPVPESTGLLLDAAGRDSYEDNEGGTGGDRTVPAKGLGGAQVDVPAVPPPPLSAAPPAGAAPARLSAGTNKPS